MGGIGGGSDGRMARVCMGLHGGGLQVCGGTSTPRSPRATMMASLSSRISSQLSSASWLSILETISGSGCSGPNFSRTTWAVSK